MTDEDPIMKVKNEQELKELLATEKDREEYERALKLCNSPDGKARQWARSALYVKFGVGDNLPEYDPAEPRGSQYND